ncbi:MAG: glycoside hydrolase family 3 C-terminal domain-containing protein [Candidatus Marinimicrobia bacterium]|nr:glycoside hydrolase family 3 C-terminal domain-containing protein [Candidatus Neomarinimicrobiota bacterium]MCF7839707.1 glycoside hydrolase family 3 C-terminal domain-containing protein [Candidatus Neomarinimicrobiota bacterium]
MDLSVKKLAQVTALVSKMTSEEKVGQMILVDPRFLDTPADISTFNIGGVFVNGGGAPPPNTTESWILLAETMQHYAGKSSMKKPLLLGTDAVHGHNNLYGSVLFPHNIGLGAGNNPQRVEEIARITSLELASTGFNWNFAPCVAVVDDPRWGRTYESFSSNTEVTTRLGSAAVRGIQSSFGTGKARVLACAKHFIGDGGTVGGVDRGNTKMELAELRARFLPPYEAAVAAGVGSIMLSYNQWNGTPCHASRYLISDLLKHELGFRGFVVSDWDAIDDLAPKNRYIDAISLSINAGLDMIMASRKYKACHAGLLELLSRGDIHLSRINDAVTRILTAKAALGLLDRQQPELPPATQIDKTKSRNIARSAVRESVVLLKNEAILPLKSKVKRIHVCGEFADDLGLQCGGWSISWQGSRGRITEGTTILEGLRNLAAPDMTVSYSPGAEVPDGIDLIIAVAGEYPYAEFHGDLTELELPQDQQAFLTALTNRNVPVLCILIAGRPLVIKPYLDKFDATVVAWLPGTEGDGVAEALFSRELPTGKLPMGWPDDKKPTS